MVALALLIAALALPDRAFAQGTTCSAHPVNGAATPLDNDSPGVFVTATICSGSSPVLSFTNSAFPTVIGGYGGNTLHVFLPDADAPASANNVKVFIIGADFYDRRPGHPSSGSLQPVNVSCVGGSVVVTASVAEVSLTSGSCNLIVNGSVGGSTISYEAELTRIGDGYQLSSGVAKGGSFGGTATPTNTAPVITGGATAAISVAENQAAVTDVETTDDNDSEGSNLTYSLSGGADQTLFTIDATTGVLTFNTAPDFGNPTDTGADNVYDVQVTVTDSGALTDVQDIAVTVTIDGQLRREQTQRAISNFMSRRADQITASDPDLVERLSQGGRDNSAGSALGFTADGSERNNQFAFSTSLRQVLRANDAAKTERRAELGQMMALGQQSLGNSNDPSEPGFDLWVQGKWAHVEDKTRKSDLGLMYTGFDYRLSPSLLVGMLAQFDWSNEKDETQNTAADGFGWMVGPYIAARVHDNLLFDGRAAWGQSDNHVSPFGTYKDSFETDRWLVRGRFTGDFQQGNWRFSPHIGVIYFEEQQKSYTDSNSVVIDAQTISLGRLTFGPKVSTSFETSSGVILAPYVGLTGIWDFEKAEIVDVTTGLATGSSDDLRARVEGGVTMNLANGWTLNGEGFYDGIGVADLDAYGGSVKLTVPLN